MPTLSLFNDTITTSKKTIGNLDGIALAIACANLIEKEHKTLIICADSFDVQRLREDLSFLLVNKKIKVFQDYETLPYDMISPH